jgi:hypothetical protein
MQIAASAASSRGNRRGRVHFLLLPRSDIADRVLLIPDISMVSSPADSRDVS